MMFHFDQLERQKTARGRELLSADRVDADKPTAVSAPPVPDNGKLRIERGEDGSIRAIVPAP